VASIFTAVFAKALEMSFEASLFEVREGHEIPRLVKKARCFSVAK
jgi:hypothetical protein